MNNKYFTKTIMYCDITECYTYHGDTYMSFINYKQVLFIDTVKFYDFFSGQTYKKKHFNHMEEIDIHIKLDFLW